MLMKMALTIVQKVYMISLAALSSLDLLTNDLATEKANDLWTVDWAPKEIFFAHNMNIQIQESMKSEVVGHKLYIHSQRPGIQQHDKTNHNLQFMLMNNFSYN